MGSWKFRNITTDTDFWPLLNSINISDQQPCNLATFSGRIVDVNALTEEVEVEVLYAADDVSFEAIFRGNVSVLTEAHIEPIAEPAVYEFSARDYTALLEDSGQGVLGNRNVTETAFNRVIWIMSQGNDFGITTAGVEANATLVGPFDYSAMNKREALGQVAGIVDSVSYVNADKELQFYSANAVIAAPFELATPASPPTSYPYRAFRRDRDATDRADEVVAYGSDGLFVVRTRAGAPAESLRKRRSISTSLVAEADLVLAGDAELDRIALVQQVGSLVIRQQGLKSGMTVHIVNPTHAIDDDFVISSVNTRHVDTNPSEVGGLGGEAEFTIGFSDRLLCTPRFDLSRNDTNTDTKPDCSICPRTLTLLPAGFGDNISLARGQAGMHVYDGISLVAYDCNVQKVRENASALSALSLIYHEPGIYTGLLAGDRVFHLDPDLGPYGATRWSIADAIDAVDVMDIRKFWAIGAGGPADINETFNRSTSSPALGATDTGEAYFGLFDSTADSAGDVTLGTVRADGSKLLMTGSNGAADFRKSLRSGSPAVYDRGNDFILEARFRVNFGPTTFGNAPRMGFALGGVSGMGVYLGYYDLPPNTTDYPVWDMVMGYTQSGGVETLSQATRPPGSGNAGIDNPGFALNTWMRLIWDHRVNQGICTFTITDDSGTPIYTLTGTDVASDAGAYPGIDGLVIYGGSGVGTIEIDSYSVVGASADRVLQSRSMVDGSLIASETLAESTDQIRRTPNGQHVFVTQGTDTLLHYNRRLTLVDTVTVTGFYTDLQEWNVDDAYNIYRLANNVLERYDSTGSLDWTVDLGALYDYHYPSLPTWPSGVGTGQQVVTHENRLRVVGYAGGADWLDGSDAIVLSLHPGNGGLISNRHIAGGPTDAAQAIALEPLGRCLWIAGAADGDEIDGVALSGASKWLVPLDEGDSGGVVALATGEDV